MSTKLITLIFLPPFLINTLSAQQWTQNRSLYDSVSISAKYQGVDLRLVTVFYKDTLDHDLRYSCDIVPPRLVWAYPIVHNQRIEVYQNGKRLRWHYLKIPKGIFFTRRGEKVRYQTIVVDSLQVKEKDGDWLFVAYGCELGCSAAHEFVGVYSRHGETMCETYATALTSQYLFGSKNWPERFGYPDTGDWNILHPISLYRSLLLKGIKPIPFRPWNDDE